MTGHWLAAAIQTPEQIHLAWPAPSPAQPSPTRVMESSSAVLSAAVHRVDTIGGAGSGAVVPGRRLTARRSHDLETRSWKLEFQIMNCSQQPVVGQGAVQCYVGSVFTFKSELSQDPRWSFQHWVSVWRLSPSVPLSQQNQVYQWSIHFSLHNHTKTYRWLILLLSMGMRTGAVQSLQIVKAADCWGCSFMASSPRHCPCMTTHAWPVSPAWAVQCSAVQCSATRACNEGPSEGS